MANEFIIRKGYKSLSDSQITGSLSVSNAVTASFFTGSFRGDGSELTGIDGFPFTGSASISGSLVVVGPVTATEFIGNGSQLTGIDGFPYTGSAIISGSLQVTGSISTDTDATINSLTVGKGGGNLENNTVLGYEAFISNVEGEGNVAIGYKALSSSLAGMGPNTAVGNQALANNIYGFRNTAVGHASLFSNTGGDFNTAVGNTALVSNIDGHENIAIGDGTLNDNTEGDNNTGVGTFALYSNTAGDNNTAIGHSSLYNNLTGSNNTAIGTDAGKYAGSSVTGLTSVNNSIFVGYQSRALNAVGDTNEIVIGHNIVGLGSNTTVIGNNSTVSTTLKGAVSASFFTGSFRGDGSELTGIDGFPFTGSAAISGSLIVDGNVIADSFTGSIQGTATSASYVNIVNVDGFTAYSSSVNTAIGSVLDATTPLTATINNTNSPFTITSQSIVIVDSTNGNVTVNLPDLNTIVGTENQKPILIYKNDYSQNVIFVSPSGSQLINGSNQDVIVSIQIGVVYNPTSGGYVTAGTSAQSLAELELFFLPLTQTGSLSVATASYVEYTDVVNKPTLVSGSSQISFSGITNKPTLVSGSAQVSFTGIINKPSLVSGSAQVSFTGIINKPTLVSGSSQVTYSGLTGKPSGIVSSSVQVKEYNVFATTGSNQFNGNQSITGSLTVSGQVVAQTLNVQQVTSSIVYSSGSNIFGNDVSNTQQFTGSLQVSGSSHYLLGNVGVGVNNPQTKLHINGALTFTEVGYNTTFKHSISNSHSNGSNPNNYLGFNISDGSGNTVERMRIDGNGNFGIGTISPASRLNVAGAKTNSGDLSNAANQLAVTDTTATAAGVGGRISFLGSYTATPDYITFGAIEVLKVNANNYGSASWNNAAMRFIVGNNDNDANAGRLLERMRITTDGEVLIGATGNNFGKLDVTVSPSSYTAALGLGFLTNSGEGNSVGISFKTKVSLSGAIWENARIAAFTDAVSSSAYGALAFYTMNATTLSERMRIGNNGFVGIGTGSPATNLHVVKDSSSPIRMERTGASAGFVDLSLFGAGGSNYFALGGDRIHSGQINNLTTASAANVFIGTDSNGITNVLHRSTSSLKYKIDIRDYDKGLDFIKTLRPVYYKGKNDGDKQFAGLIAEEVHDLGLEEFVQYAQDGSPDALAYTHMVALLVNGIKEQQSQIEILKAEIQTLKQ